MRPREILVGDAGEWDATIRMAAWRQNSMSFFRYLRNQGTWEHHSLMFLEAISLRTRKWMGKYTKCPLNKLQLGPSSSAFPSHALPSLVILQAPLPGPRIAQSYARLRTFVLAVSSSWNALPYITLNQGGVSSYFTSSETPFWIAQPKAILLWLPFLPLSTLMFS